MGQSLADSVARFLHGSPPDIASEYVEGFVTHWLTDPQTPQLPDPLLITEGSQLTWDIIRLFVERGKFLPMEFARTIVARFDRQLVVDRYIETHLAVKALRAGRKWYECGTESMGCGSIHRAAAFGLCCWNDPPALRTGAQQQSQITHRNAVAGTASILVAELIASTIRRECGPGCSSLPIAIPRDDHGLGRLLEPLPHLFALSPPTALAEITVQQGNAADGLADHLGQGLLWAIYCTVHSDWEFSRAIPLVLRAGGALVAPAALVGALCGAARGMSSLPGHLLERLSDRGIHRQADFLDWCQRCAEITADSVSQN